ncbi:MAG TPA: hypothetical protein VND22_10210 [Actinomycetota bacterium]|nr:hypothetical protein [Actinomycetota bacterium]
MIAIRTRQEESEIGRSSASDKGDASESSPLVRAHADDLIDRKVFVGGPGLPAVAAGWETD